MKILNLWWDSSYVDRRVYFQLLNTGFERLLSQFIHTC